MKEFDYYICIDYSAEIIGYIVIEKRNIKEILEKTSKFRHFQNVRHDSAYITAIKRRIETNKIISLLLRHKVKEVRLNIELFAEIIEFIAKNIEKSIFISIDDNFYISFIRLTGLIANKNNITIIRESKLKKYSSEYQLNLIIDNLVNIERKKLR